MLISAVLTVVFFILIIEASRAIALWPDFSLDGASGTYGIRGIGYVNGKRYCKLVFEALDVCCTKYGLGTPRLRIWISVEESQKPPSWDTESLGFGMYKVETLYVPVSTALNNKALASLLGSKILKDHGGAVTLLNQLDFMEKA